MRSVSFGRRYSSIMYLIASHASPLFFASFMIDIWCEFTHGVEIFTLGIGATAIGTSGCAFTYVGQLPTAPVCIAAFPVLNRFAVPNSDAASPGSGTTRCL